MKLRLVTKTRTIDVTGDRIVSRSGEADLVLDVGGADLRPGLVNAHDHLHRNHLPRLGEPPYASAAAWGADLHARFADDLARRRLLPRRDALLFGALKNILGGATWVVHHDPWEDEFDRDFPVRVVRIPAVDALDDATAAPSTGPWALHLAEGTDPRSIVEIDEAAARGLLSDRLVAVHLVGAAPWGVSRLAAAGCAAVWCPTSNRFLYGATAPRALFDSGVDVLIGTDALVSAEGTLFAELKAARTLGFLSDSRLEEAVGGTATRRLLLPPPSLEPGARADVIALGAPLLEAAPRDVMLVLTGGRPVLADERYAEIFDAAAVPSEALTVGGVPKRVAAPLASVAQAAIRLAPECGRILR